MYNKKSTANVIKNIGSCAGNMYEIGYVNVDHRFYKNNFPSAKIKHKK